MHKRPTHTAFTRVGFLSIRPSIRHIINKRLILRPVPKPTTNSFTAKRKAHLFTFSSYKRTAFVIINHYFVFTAHHVFCRLNTVDMLGFIDISVAGCAVDHEFGVEAACAAFVFFFFFYCY